MTIDFLVTNFQSLVADQSLTEYSRPSPSGSVTTVFILGCVVESLTHTALIEHPEVLSDGQLEEEIVNLLLSYLMGKQA